MNATARKLYLVLKHRFPVVRVYENNDLPEHLTRPHAPQNQPSRPKISRTGFWVECPNCHEEGQTLFIDGYYGTFDPSTQSSNLNLAVCRANNCLSDPWSRQWLARWIFEGIDEQSDVALSSSPANDNLYDPSAPLPEALPVGDVVPLDQLPDDHPAITYLEGRQFDVRELTSIWKVGFCTGSVYFQMEGRIFIPFYQGGVQVGWQGRWIGELEPGTHGPSRYYNMPGLRKGRLLYGADAASHEPLVVICEGCTDVWRVGAPGVALLGRTASKEQLRLIVSNWADRHVVVLLDADAAQEARKLYEQLRRFFPGRIVLAILPDGLDPGVCDRDLLWEFVQGTADAQGVTLPSPRESRSLIVGN